MEENGEGSLSGKFKITDLELICGIIKMNQFNKEMVKTFNESHNIWFVDSKNGLKN